MESVSSTPSKNFAEKVGCDKRSFRALVIAFFVTRHFWPSLERLCQFFAINCHFSAKLDLELSL